MPRGSGLTSALLAGCSDGAPANQGQRGPTQVGYVVAQPSAVPLQTSLGGRTVGYETSEVRPQVNGLIRRRLFTEGSYVRQGQPLFQIDASLYHAAVDQASANRSSAQAASEAARVRADRYRPLAEIEAVSKQEYTDAAAQARQATASVSQSDAALQRHGSTCVSPPCRRRSAAGSAGPCRPSARWSRPTRPSRSRSSSGSTRCLSISSNRAPTY